MVNVSRDAEQGPRHRPRRLTSISNLTKSFNGHRRNTTNDLNNYRDSESTVKTPRKRTFLSRPTVPAASATNRLPRSSTYSSIPRAVSGPRHPSKCLPTSKTTTSLIPSRIPTPRGQPRICSGLQENHEQFMPPPVLQRSQQRKKQWRHSAGPLLMPKVNTDGSMHEDTSSNYQAPEMANLEPREAESLSSTGLEETLHLKQQGSSIEFSPDVVKFSNQFQPSQTQLATNLNEDRELTNTAYNQDQGAAISPRKSFDIVQHRLLAPLEPVTTCQTSSTTSPRSNRRRDSSDLPCFASTESLALASKSTTKPSTAGVKSTVKSGLSSMSISNLSKLKLRKSVSDSRSPQHELFVEQADPSHVHNYQPHAYWTGRFVSLQDRYLKAHWREEFSTPSREDGGKAEMYGRDLRRCMWIFNELENCCETRTAFRSLMAFRKEFAATLRMPELEPKRTARMSRQITQESEAKADIVPNGPMREIQQPYEQQPMGLTFPRKPLPIPKDQAMSSPSVVSDENEQVVSDMQKETSQTSLLKEGSDKRHRQTVGRDRSFLTKIVDIGRKASWTQGYGA